MRIVFVSLTYWPPDFGGGVLNTIECLEGLAGRRHKVTVLTSGRPGLPRRESTRGLQVRRCPAVHASRMGRVIRKFVFLVWSLGKLRHLDYDVVQLGTLLGIGPGMEALAGWLLARVIRAKGARAVFVHTLADSRGAALELSGVRGWLKRCYLSQMTHVVGLSPALHKEIRKAFSHRAVLVPRGVRGDIFQPRPEEVRLRVRRRLGCSLEDVVYVFVGAIGYRKGFDVLAKAFARLSEHNRLCSLWVVGPRSRDESQNIDSLEVRTVLGLLDGNDRVTYLGRLDNRDELCEVLAAADVFVFPTRREGLPVAPMQAMATGLPVILSRIEGVTDLLSIDGVTGLFVTPGSPEELGKAMELLGTDWQLRQQMGARARDYVLRAFDWEVVLSRWEALYLGHPRTSPPVCHPL